MLLYYYYYFIVVVVVINIIYYVEAVEQCTKHKRHAFRLQYIKKKAIHKNKTIKSTHHLNTISTKLM